ncbi:hypothetical protein NQ317_005269 [Molorchus minor]|uniref:Ionotropic glutamate receptor C-terminal domain-containing protein n=1 Tax=Molorchus minor TaxID=1323400 RepID=A0ABQ9JYV1_9CUCU|nr:hypothetical protein NQ317_005269 [Molorchus minor]
MASKTITALLLLLVESSHTKFISLSNDEILTRVSLSQCIITASRRFFTSDFETVTFSLPLAPVKKSLNSSVLMNHLLLPVVEGEHRWTFLIKNLKLPNYNTREYVYKSYSYIIQIRKEGEFANNIKRLKSFMSWNPHAKFLVVSPTIFPNSHAIAVEVIQELWSHNVINAAVLLTDKTNTTIFNLFSWEPYSNSSCADNFSTTIVIDRCAFGVTDGNRSWFEEKISKEVYNCSVKVKYVEWPPFVNRVDHKNGVPMEQNPGMEVNILNMIANTLNVHLIYNQTSHGFWGHIFENGTATKDLKHLLNNEIDIAIGGYGKTHYRCLYLDCSRSFIQESLVWCVPHEPIIVGFKNMINILRTEVWMLILCVYLVVTFFIWFISYKNIDESRSYKKFLICLQKNFAILIGFAIHILPKTSKVRCILSMFILFSLILNAVYTSYLTSILSTPSYVEKYDKMESIYQHKLKTFFMPNSVYFFQNYEGRKQANKINNVPMSLIMEKFQKCSDISTCLGNITTNKDSAVCLPQLYKQYLANNVNDIRKKMSSVYCLKESLVTIHVNIIMRKGFPLYKSFDDVLKRIISAGFISKWEKDNLEDKRRLAQNLGVDENVSIKYVNLIPVFWMFLVGNLVSALVFVGEHVLYKRTIRMDTHLSQPQTSQPLFLTASSLFAPQLAQPLQVAASTFGLTSVALQPQLPPPLAATSGALFPTQIPRLGAQQLQQAQQEEHGQHRQLRPLGGGRGQQLQPLERFGLDGATVGCLV